MRIAITCHPTQGGSGVVATELAMALAQRGHEVHVVCYERPFRLHDMPNLYFERVNITDYPLFRYPPHDLCLANKLAEVVVRRKIDVIHAHYAVPHAVSAILARDILSVCQTQVKVVTTLHGTDITLVGSHADFKRVCQYAMMKCHGLTTVSQWLSDRTMDAFALPREPVVIPNFVDCDRFTSKGRAGYPADGAFRILHASNFRPVKRVFDVVRTFALIHRQLPGARLMMVGEGPDLGLAQELAGELGVCGSIDWAGAQVDIEQAYRDSHLYLLLSDYESFGLSALEALACGTPVIGSHSGGLIEVVAEGQTGHLRRVGDTEGFAAAALEILNSPDTWVRYRNAAMADARKRYCMRQIVPMYEDFYERIIREGVMVGDGSGV